MSVLGRIEEIVKKAADAGERELPRNLMVKVSVLLREQVATHAERERVIAQATEGFGRRYAAQLRTARHVYRYEPDDLVVLLRVVEPSEASLT